MNRDTALIHFISRRETTLKHTTAIIISTGILFGALGVANAQPEPRAQPSRSQDPMVTEHHFTVGDDIKGGFIKPGDPIITGRVGSKLKTLITLRSTFTDLLILSAEGL